MLVKVMSNVFLGNTFCVPSFQMNIMIKCFLNYVTP